MTSNRELKQMQRAEYRRSTKKNNRSSSTPGKTKSPSCQASSIDRFYAKYSRAARLEGYAQWCLKKNGR